MPQADTTNASPDDAQKRWRRRLHQWDGALPPSRPGARYREFCVLVFRALRNGLGERQVATLQLRLPHGETRRTQIAVAAQSSLSSQARAHPVEPPSQFSMCQQTRAHAIATGEHAPLPSRARRGAGPAWWSPCSPQRRNPSGSGQSPHPIDHPPPRRHLGRAHELMQRRTPVTAIQGAVRGVTTHRVLCSAPARLIEQQHCCHCWAREKVRIHVAIWSRAVPYRCSRHLHWNCQLHDHHELPLFLSRRKDIARVSPEGLRRRSTHHFKSSAGLGRTAMQQPAREPNHEAHDPTRANKYRKTSEDLQGD